MGTRTRGSSRFSATGRREADVRLYRRRRCQSCCYLVRRSSGARISWSFSVACPCSPWSGAYSRQRLFRHSGYWRPLHGCGHSQSSNRSPMKSLERETYFFNERGCQDVSPILYSNFRDRCNAVLTRPLLSRSPLSSYPPLNAEGGHSNERRWRREAWNIDLRSLFCPIYLEEREPSGNGRP